jgi:eukaryotic-like serine/threonine-protein kinase
VNRVGKPIAAAPPQTTAALYQTHALSPDGTLLILERVDHVTGNSDLWIRDLARGSTSPLTRDPGMEQHPVWSPDGRQFAFQRVTGGSNEIVRHALDSGGPQTILRSPRRTYPTDWTADGRWILYETPDDQGKYDLWMIAADGKQAPVPLVQSPFNERMGQFSPDGKWLAYMSDESGRDEVFVRGVSPSAVRVMISTQGGVQPRWSRDGKALYYKQGSTIYAMPVEAGAATFRAGSPERLFEPASLGLQNAHMQYSVGKDGRTFLVRVSPEPAGAETIHALVNWGAAVQP